MCFRILAMECKTVNNFIDLKKSAIAEIAKRYAIQELTRMLIVRTRVHAAASRNDLLNKADVDILKHQIDQMQKAIVYKYNNK
jgi:hypothetical protein